MKTLLIRKVYFFLIFILSPTLNFGQVNFSMDPSFSGNMKAAAFVGSYSTVMIFNDQNFAYYPLTSEANMEWYPIPEAKHISNAVAWDADNVLIFEGASYRNFQISTTSFTSGWQTWQGLPPNWRNQIDASLQWAPGVLMFISGLEFVLFDLQANTISSQGLLTEWPGWPGHWTAVESAVNVNDGYINFFRQGEVLSYDLNNQSLSQPYAMTGLQNAMNRSVSQPTSAAVGRNAKNKYLNIVPRSKKKSPIIGSGNGNKFSNILANNTRIKAIKVYSSYVDGNEVISGLQIMSEDSRKFVKPTRLLGRRTKDETVFELEAGESVVKIFGCIDNSDGGFLQGIQITTNVQEFPPVGTRNHSEFEYVLNEDDQFLGFNISSAAHITGFGIVYTGNPTLARIAPTEKVVAASNSSTYSRTTRSSSSVSNKAEESNDGGRNFSNTSSGQSAGEYSDQYEDYVETSLGDLNDYSNVQPLPGIDWLAAGFDILYFDPIRPNNTEYRKEAQSIVVTTSGKRGGNKNQYLKPYGTNFASLNDGMQVDTSAMIASYEDYRNQFKMGLKGSVEVPKVAKASKSLSFSKMNSSNVGAEKVFMMNTSKRKIHSVSLKLFWEDISLGKLRQRLHPEFKQAVKNLPVVKGNYENVHIKKKNQTLPGNISSVASKYNAFVKKFGTHFAEKVIWGGQYVTRMELLKSNFEKSQKTAVEYQQEASVQIKKVKLGSEQSVGNTNESTQGSRDMNNRTIKYIIGGNGEDDISQWRNKVDDNPAPVEISFMAMCDILIKEMFPNDPDIEQKSHILRLVIEKYIQDNYEEAQKSKGGFWKKVAPIQESGMVTLHNNGAYVMWAKISYFTRDGVHEVKEIPGFPIGQVRQMPIPLGSHTILVEASQTGGTIFTDLIPKPTKKCYKCKGSAFNAWKEECKD